MINKDTAYKKISELVERFNEQYDSYKKSDYNETLTRRDFIDPFFKALGWDIDNEQGYAESYREVIHEDRVKVSGATKAPDYSFRLVGGKRLFFVEAKKPSLSVKEEIPSAYQIRRYGWSAKLPVSIITDFEEFSVYDCTIKPKPTDKASTARIMYIAFRDYLKEFDVIWETFSKERVLKGSFDKFVKSDTYKKGTATVDKDFLQSLDRWRTYLATSVALNNQKLDEEEINFAVQQTIDRIIFLRIAEDRGVEPYGNLKDAIKQGDFYKNLFQQFCRADEKYNSGLFDFNKDQISKHLKIDNKVTKTIINELYYPESPYEFSVLSVEILGSAYEQFLGKVIRITPAYHAKIEEKPEVRKAGGVYYTPQYIVEYIVHNTVGKLIEGKTPKEISKIKIVDPACGSGSFLLGAYQYLLDYHKNYYHTRHAELPPDEAKRRAGVSASTKKGEIPKRVRNDIPLTPEGNLNTNEKKRILLNNIFGVDIDVNAVEVTKLSLLLKCMEGETEASINHQLKMFNERILPDLEKNIKCGNSLIDTDFYASQLDFGDENLPAGKAGKIKPFNWQREFPEVFKDRMEDVNIKEELKTIAHQAKTHAKKALEYSSELVDKLELLHEPKANYQRIIKGGFDVVIGNPPYVTIGGKEDTLFLKQEVDYLLSRYISNQYKPNLYAFFYEKGLFLLKENGLISYIVPRTFIDNIYYKALREYFVKNSRIISLLKLNYEVFDEATTGGTSICIFQKSISKNIKVQTFNINNQEEFTLAKSFLINQKDILIGENKSFSFSNPETQKIVFKISNENPKLEFFCSVNNGVNTGNAANILLSEKPLNKNYRKILEGKDINRFRTKWKGLWIHYDPSLKSRIKLKDLQTKQNNIDFALRDVRIFDTKKIIIRQTADRIIATVDSDKYITRHSTHCILNDFHPIDLKFLLGLLNSKLMDFYYNALIPEKGKAFAEVKAINVKQLPIKNIDRNNRPEIEQHNEIIKLVDSLLKLNQEKMGAKLQTKINQLQSKIEYCEGRINEIVYQLYGLTEDEIKIVEKS